MKNNKILGKERRNLILNALKETDEPITGTKLAEQMNVSRQVIVQDISLLKAKNEPIIATSQGYIYLHNNNETTKYERIIVCSHKPEQTRYELQLIVDQGVTVKNVFIEHPIYGDLKASIMVSNRREVDQFIKKVEETAAPYLLQLKDDGAHLHTLEADSEEKLQLACQALDEAGYLIEG
ncbi:transcription repressor NadR [Aquibacillus sediminis]|uniref:transcription repressor NadR n=1 Tax=Aquibacillus sediminis TaxID=2574734 RepID=UPI0011094B5F|nr:transcription repressor NadR [Aquibacillus sediminis]